MKSFYLTDTGLVREHNEDSVIISENGEGCYLMAVADGMGGHQAGEVHLLLLAILVKDLQVILEK